MLQELQAGVTAFCVKFSPPDAREWRLVVAEINGFLHAGDFPCISVFILLLRVIFAHPSSCMRG